MGDVQTQPRPPTPPLVRKGPQVGPAIFWPHRRESHGLPGGNETPCPVDLAPLPPTPRNLTTSSQSLPTPKTGSGSRTRKNSTSAEETDEPGNPVTRTGRARVFAGWGSEGKELYREVWQVPVGVSRPTPQRAATISFSPQAQSTTTTMRSDDGAECQDTPRPRGLRVSAAVRRATYAARHFMSAAMRKIVSAAPFSPPAALRTSIAPPYAWWRSPFGDRSSHTSNKHS